MKLPSPIKTDDPIPWCLFHLLTWPTLCLWSVCFSLNKSTSYLSLCLSLNSFCDETSRTWASLSPETRCVISVGRLWDFAGFESSLVGSSPNHAFGRVRVPATWIQVGLGGVRIPAHGFKSQSEVHGFNTVFCFICFPCSPFFPLMQSVL